MTNPIWILAVSWIGATSAAGFIAMGTDKWRATRHQRRVAEKTLFTLGAIGGAFGVVAAMRVFHHKNLKDSFADITFIEAVLWLAALVLLEHAMGPPAVLG